MNIAVTGATSFIGNHVIKKLIENNENRIWAIVRPGSPNRYRLPIHEHIRVVELDLMEIITLKEYIKEQIDIFYHFAWEGVRGAKRDDYELQNNNYLASLRAFELLMQQKPGFDRYQSGCAGDDEDCGTCRFYRPGWKYEFCVFKECPYCPGKRTRKTHASMDK